MVKYLTHYYNAGTTPFRSLSALPEEEAIKIMEDLYADDAMWGRFKDPAWYIRRRKQTEAWVRSEFILKGRHPKEVYPFYMIIGECDMLEESISDKKLEKIQIPISKIGEDDVSFTYIDSMFSFTLGQDKTPQYYQPEYHGKVFTLSEILTIIEEKGTPTKGWWGNLPEDFFPYIEVQVWNHSIIKEYIESIY